MRHRKSCFISTQVDFNNKMCLIWYPLALVLALALALTVALWVRARA